MGAEAAETARAAEKRAAGMTACAFTSAEDRIILDGRASGLSWLVIGSQIGTTGKACQ